jgi:hypothetical protein
MIWNVESGCQALITLDGEQVLYPQYADSDAGVVRAPLIGKKLEAIYDHERDDFAVVERQGKVAIIALGAPSDGYPFSIDQRREGELSDRWDQPVCSIVDALNAATSDKIWAMRPRPKRTP